MDLGLYAPPETGGPLPITASRMGHLWDALSRAYDQLGFADVAEDEVFRQLVLARIIEPTSKLDSLRVLEKVGVAPVSYRTLKRRLPDHAAETWRERLAALCAHHVGLGPATLLLYDVTALYFETEVSLATVSRPRTAERPLRRTFVSLIPLRGTTPLALIAGSIAWHARDPRRDAAGHDLRMWAARSAMP